MQKICSALVLVASFLMVNSTVNAQSPVTILFNGVLTDIEDTSISNDTVNIDFTIISSDEEPLFNKKITVPTTAAGEFMADFTNLPELFNSSANRQLVDIVVVMNSVNGASWMDQKDFMVKYHFEKLGNEEYSITRFEGQTMEHYDMHPLWDFNDVYPFGYLNSRFMISFSTELSDPNSIIAILDDIPVPEEVYEEAAPAPMAAPPPPQRGVKGGYAVGGYKKK
ncbi:MAG: hypothetical protein WD052_13870 [Bacteroidales bacterium]